MKFLATIILIFFSLLLIPGRHVAQNEICNGGSTSVMDGEYNIMNNVWGASTAQCIEVYPDSSYFKVSLSEHNNGNNVASYPSIFKGCHWGWCTSKNNPMPVPIREIESAPFIWSINTEDIPGTWNAAFDIWFSRVSSGTAYSAELMIWCDYNGGAAPAGSKRGTVEIGGTTWDVYFAAWTSWNYIAYKAVTPVDSVNLDLRDFIDDSLLRGYLFTPWYLIAIETGFEIFSQGQGLESKYFYTDVFKTDNPINYPPASFRIQSPTDGFQVDTTQIVFKWQETSDPDLDEVEFLLVISGGGDDTVVTGIDTNTVVFDGSTFLKPGTTYTWYISATDGIDTTMSTTQRTFVTPGTVDVTDQNSTPDDFYLFQNYPNPFNPSTEIVFVLDAASEIDLSVFNFLGEKVKTLQKGFLQSGKHSVTFNAAELTSGIYYYRIETPTQSVGKKCVYLK